MMWLGIEYVDDVPHFKDAGCGCCAQHEPVTIPELESYISELQEVLKECNALLERLNHERLQTNVSVVSPPNDVH